VAINSARLRISFNSNHQKNQIIKLTKLLKKYLKNII
jgi:7-keto-8-aminopelargonate synthetase-like enzyme